MYMFYHTSLPHCHLLLVFFYLYNNMYYSLANILLDFQVLSFFKQYLNHCTVHDILLSYPRITAICHFEAAFQWERVKTMQLAAHCEPLRPHMEMQP